MSDYKRLLMLVAVSVLLFLPAMIKGIPKGGDLPHHYRTAISFYEAIHSGSIYPGWNAQATEGYGDVSFRFYPPSTYYLLCIFRSLTGSWYYGSLLAFVLLSTLGGLGVYSWARCFLSRNLSMWAGMIYTIAPFHVNDIYQAFMLPQYAGCAVLPFCFAFVNKVCDKGRARDVAGLSTSYAVLILTHLPLAVIGSVALFIYTVLIIGRAELRKKLLRLSVAVALGLAASARYWMVMVAEIHWLKGESTDWYDYRYNFLFWKAVESSTSWWANVLALATMMLFLPGFLFSRRASHHDPLAGTRRITLLALLAFAMATPLSKPIWDILPGLKEVQFPWRWLTVTSMAGAISLAASLPFWLQKRHGRERPLALLAAACLLIPCAITASQIIRGATYISRPSFESLAENIARTPSLGSWLPVWAKESVRPMENQVDLQSRRPAILSWNPYSRCFQVESGQAQEARVRTFYYPYWIATANGKQLPTRPDDDGALLISVPSDSVKIDLEFREPTWVSIGAIISLISWILIASLGLWPLILERIRKSALRSRSDELRTLPQVLHNEGEQRVKSAL